MLLRFGQVCDLPLLIRLLLVYPSPWVLHLSDFFFPILLFESNKPCSKWATLYPPHEFTVNIWELVDIGRVGKLLHK